MATCRPAASSSRWWLAVAAYILHTPNFTTMHGQGNRKPVCAVTQDVVACTGGVPLCLLKNRCTAFVAYTTFLEDKTQGLAVYLKLDGARASKRGAADKIRQQGEHLQQSLQMMWWGQQSRQQRLHCLGSSGMQLAL